MKNCKILFSENAKGHLKRLPCDIALRIVRKLKYFELANDPLLFAKKLKNRKLGQYRFRIGDYRVLFDINSTESIIYILAIKHRREVYL